MTQLRAMLARRSQIKTNAQRDTIARSALSSPNLALSEPTVTLLVYNNRLLPTIIRIIFLSRAAWTALKAPTARALARQLTLPCARPATIAKVETRTFSRFRAQPVLSVFQASTLMARPYALLALTSQTRFRLPANLAPKAITVTSTE